MATSQKVLDNYEKFKKLRAQGVKFTDATKQAGIGSGTVSKLKNSKKSPKKQSHVFIDLERHSTPIEASTRQFIAVMVPSEKLAQVLEVIK